MVKMADTAGAVDIIVVAFGEDRKGDCNAALAVAL